MSNGIPKLPTLTVNRSFMEAFLAADTPCCALGLVEVDYQLCGFVALRPDSQIPSDVTDRGFNFGHMLVGNERFEVIQLTFEFYGYETFSVMINPNNAIAQRVLKQMIDSGDYFFFALDEGRGSAVVFRSEIGPDNLANLKENWERLENSTTTTADLLQANVGYIENPFPLGMLMHWVCNDNPGYLDLSKDRLDLYSP